MSKRATALVLLILALILGALGYFALGLELPDPVREIPVTIDLDWQGQRDLSSWASPARSR